MSKPKTKLHEVLENSKLSPVVKQKVIEDMEKGTFDDPPEEPTNATQTITTLTEEGNSEWQQPLEDKQNEQPEPNDDPEPELLEHILDEEPYYKDEELWRKAVLELLFRIMENTGVKRRKIEQAVRPEFVEVVTNKFPDDLKKLLNFQVVNDGTVLIHPLQYLGKETFAKIARIVSQELGGSYASDGKNSHRRVGE